MTIPQLHRSESRRLYHSSLASFASSVGKPVWPPSVTWVTLHVCMKIAADRPFSSQAAGQQIVALANLGHSSFSASNWQISLISFAVLAFVILVNTVLFRNLPLIEGCIMMLHVFAFFAIVVVLA